MRLTPREERGGTSDGVCQFTELQARMVQRPCFGLIELNSLGNRAGKEEDITL